MDSNTSFAGMALLCNAEGTILDVIHDNFGLGERNIQGQTFPLLVDPASFQKALSFLVEIRAGGTVFDWEMNLPLAGTITTLYFTGLTLDDNLLILGARTRQGVHQFLEEMMHINNEQTNALRVAAKEQVELTRPTERDNALYDELSRLNNELANLQRELVKKNVELEKLDALKNQFLGMAAHDLRLPLGIIMSYSEFLLDETAEVLGKEHLEFLSIIRTSSDFMLGMVNDLLSVSVIESGKLRLDLQSVDLIALVKRNVTLNGVLAKKKQIDLQVQHDLSLPPILLDSAKIEQVLNNLISNAVKYSAPESIVEISLTCSNSQVIISVKDHGPGIPPDERDKLFKWFGRTSVQSTGGEKSTGLGLAIAQRIVQAHKGKIWVESQFGNGSTFYVSLPIDHYNEMM